ncbi:MAG: DUF6781 family protein [Gammaproteobacteria bacterium]|nr:DUF6781 family protein [Gammaproteobacteria bacterium]
MSEENDKAREDIERAAREAVGAGVDIRERVRAITVDALERGRLEGERIKEVLDAVTEGVSEGARERGEETRAALEEGLRGVDDALAKAAHASQLAIEEARERMSRYSREDLDQARRELESLETRFLDVLDRLAQSGGEVFESVRADVARHLRDSGTAVGRQVSDEMGAMGEQLRRDGEERLREGVDAALSAGARIAEVASGFLAGLADTLESTRRERGRPRRDDSEGDA